MNKVFEVELLKLKERLTKMFFLAEEQVENAFKATLADDSVNNELVKKIEKKADKLELKTEKLTQNIFALSQPVASDLRFIIGANSISNELERICDLAYDIIKHSNYMNADKALLENIGFAGIKPDFIIILNKVHEVFINQNDELSYRVIKELNDFEIRIYGIIENNENILPFNQNSFSFIYRLILVVHSLARITKHYQNICEVVIYISGGKNIKHSGHNQKSTE